MKGQGKSFPEIINPEIPIPSITNNPMEEYIALPQNSNFMAMQEPQIFAHLEDQSQDNSILNPSANRNFYCATNLAVSSLLNLNCKAAIKPELMANIPGFFNLDLTSELRFILNSFAKKKFSS